MYKVNVTYAPNEQKIRSIKAVRAIYRVATNVPLGLREAKGVIDDAIDHQPTVVLDVPNRVDAVAAVAYLGAYGIIANVIEPQVTVPMSIVQDAIVTLQRAGQWGLADRFDEALRPRV